MRPAESQEATQGEKRTSYANSSSVVWGRAQTRVHKRGKNLDMQKRVCFGLSNQDDLWSSQEDPNVFVRDACHLLLGTEEKAVKPYWKTSFSAFPVSATFLWAWHDASAADTYHMGKRLRPAQWGWEMLVVSWLCSFMLRSWLSLPHNAVCCPLPAKLLHHPPTFCCLVFSILDLCFRVIWSCVHLANLLDLFCFMLRSWPSLPLVMMLDVPYITQVFWSFLYDSKLLDLLYLLQHC